MWLPQGMTEQEVMDEMTRVINQVMRDITPFGFYRGDELRQQAFVFGIEAMNTEKYDISRPLGGFLRKCIVNRLISLSRDKYSRNEPPCRKCCFFDKDKKKSESGCTAFAEKMKCSKFKSFDERNKAKRDIMNLKSKIPLYEDTIGCDYKAFIDVDNRDFVENLNKYLSPACRETLREIIEGKSVKKNKLDKLIKEVDNVLTKSSN